MMRFEKWLQRGEEGLATFLIGILTLTIGGQILFRYFLNSPLSWSEELSQFLLICLSFVAATAVLKRGEHYSVDAFVNMMPSHLRRIVEVSAGLVQLALLLGLAYYSFSIAQLYVGTVSLILRIPEEIKAYLMTYCFLSMALHIALRVARTMKREV